MLLKPEVNDSLIRLFLPSPAVEIEEEKMRIEERTQTRIIEPSLQTQTPIKSSGVSYCLLIDHPNFSLGQVLQFSDEILMALNIKDRR
jgi:hypothetical protein